MLPCKCPSCNTQLQVKSLVCENCTTEVIGRYDLPQLLLLSKEELQFVRKIGNKGAHATERPTLDEVRTCSMTIMKIVDRFEKTMH